MPPLLLLALAPTAVAEGVTTTLHGSYIERLRVGTYTVTHHELMYGSSEGPVSFQASNSFAIGAADNRNLGTYFARAGTDSHDWVVELGAWQDTNGNKADFFVFEVGGNDGITVAPRFPDGSWGQDVPVTGWTGTGYRPAFGPNANQEVFGLAFGRSDLRYANGSPVAASQTITAIRVRSNEVDGAAFLAVDPHSPGGPGPDGGGGARVHGDALRPWHPMHVDFHGPWACATDLSPQNPFLDYRLTVRFDGPGGVSYLVPGFFDGDGEGGLCGTVWRARFAPDRPGHWSARASFRVGPGVAVSLAPGAGSSGYLTGSSVDFEIAPPLPVEEGLYADGRQEYVGGHHRRHASGRYFIKTGTNSPENFLAYRGFDGVGKVGGVGVVHEYASHAADWRSGDPYFESATHENDSRAIIGAINYLSSVGVNSLFTMLMNLGGDGQDVYPFLDPKKDDFNNTHYDLARLRQWNIVFEHAARKGVALHFGLAETEPANEKWLDEGGFGVQRKLFFREMIARFGHFPAVKWMLSEENDFSVTLLKQFADYIVALDPYGHHTIAVHNHPNDFSDYEQIYGEGAFTASAMQYNPDLAGAQVEEVREKSAQAGHPWVVEMDENNPWTVGATDTNSDELRKRVLYDVLFSGGHLEWYMGWHDLPLGGDLSVEDFRTREEVFLDSRRARRFLEQNVPFQEMQPHDELLSGESSSFGGGEVFAVPGKVYAIYLPKASPSGTLNLSGHPGSFRKRWFNPRNGQFAGGVQTLAGGGQVALGQPPNAADEDWVVLVDQDGDLSGDVLALSASAGGTQTLTLDAGPQHAGRIYHVIGSLSGTTPGMPLGSVVVPVNRDRYTDVMLATPNTGIFHHTRGQLDGQGRATARITVPPGRFGMLVGLTMHHAYFLSAVSPDYASIAVPLLIQP